MAQHDYNLANQSGADFRADLNNALAAIATVNSGATEPSTTFAHQLWVDTANSVLKIRNAANSDWITFGVSISSSNVFTGNLTGDVVGNITGDLVGNVTGDLTGNSDTATTLETARTISLSGDVVGSVSFDGSANVDIDTVVQINSITLGTDTTGDYVESISGGTGVTITGGTGESSTPVVAIGQAVAVTSDVTFNTITASNEFIGDLEGGIRFNAKADGALSAGDVVYISGVSGDVPTVAQAKADDASKMPAFGLALSDANDNAELQVVTFGTIENLDTSGVSEGQILYVSTTAGAYTTTAPTGESSQIQNIGKVIRSHASAGSIKVGGAGRSNATPNLNNGKIFIGNGSNQSATSTLDTSIVPENTNLYWTTARGESMFDTRLATKDTGDLAEGSNLYYTTTRVNSDFDTRLATKDTGDLAEGLNLYYTTTRVNSDFDTRLATKDTDDVSEGSVNLYYTSGRANSDFDTRLATKSTSDVQEGVNLYYTDARFDSRLATKDTDDVQEGSNLYYTQARFDSAFSNKTTSDLTEGTNLYYTDARANSAIDTRVTKSFVDALNIQAASVDANSVALGTDTTGNYIQTITGTANKITVTGSGSESADVTLTLPDDVQIADSLTVAGNLTVNGTLTSLDTTNLDIEDNLFQLNAGLTGSPVNDSGMLINRGDQDNGIFMWDESADKFTLGLTTADGTSTGNITLNSLGTLVANIEGNITGNVTGTVSDVSNHDTDDINEGSTNLYFTNARADARVNLQTGANLDLSSKSTSDLSEGTNEYFTTARARSSISASGDISYNSSTGVISFTATAAPVTSVNTLTGAVVLDSDDIAEGSTNLYYTDARARAAISEGSTQLAYNSTTGVLTFTQGDTDTVSEGTTNLYYTSARFDSGFSGKSTSDLSEGTNLYFTDARAQAVSINNVVEDTTPQLGGDLDLNSNDITGTGNINITGTIQSSGNITGTLATAAQPNITSVGTLTGLTTTGDINLGDNDKAIFGAGSDLQIYHDGSNSYVNESGTGNLYLQGTNHVYLTNSDGSKTYFAGNSPSGWVKLYHDNSVKLETTSTGIDVTGTVTADGLTVDGTSEIRSTFDATLNITSTAGVVSTDDVYGSLNFVTEDGSVADDRKNAATIQAINAGGSGSYCDLDFYTSAGTGATNTKSLKIAYNGDISFYDDTGTSQALYWDASAESLGIGTTSPVGNLHVQASSTGINANSNFRNLVLEESGNVGLTLLSANTSLGSIIFGDSDSSTAGRLQYDHSDNSLQFFCNGSERLHIDSSGSVGIGTDSPATGIDVQTTNYTYSGTTYDIYGIVGLTSGGVRLGGDSSNSDSVIGTTGTGNMQFVTYNGSAWGNRMTLTNSGKLLIGEASGDAFNTDSILRLQKTGQRVFQQFKTDADQQAAILFGDVGDDVRGSIEFDNNTDDMYFATGNNTEAVRILSTGGITFNGDTATANALDDYEEGDWTPTIAGATTAGTYTYGTQVGRYRKIGNIVVANFRIDNITVVSAGSGNLRVDGFPFNSESTSLQYYWGSVVLEYFDVAPSTVTLTLGLIDGADSAYVWETRDSTTNGIVSVTDLNTSGSADVWGQVTYMT